VKHLPILFSLFLFSFTYISYPPSRPESCDLRIDLSRVQYAISIGWIYGQVKFTTISYDIICIGLSERSRFLKDLT